VEEERWSSFCGPVLPLKYLPFDLSIMNCFMDSLLIFILFKAEEIYQLTAVGIIISGNTYRTLTIFYLEHLNCLQKFYLMCSKRLRGLLVIIFHSFNPALKFPSFKFVS